MKCILISLRSLLGAELRYAAAIGARTAHARQLGSLLRRGPQGGLLPRGAHSAQLNRAAAAGDQPVDHAATSVATAGAPGAVRGAVKESSDGCTHDCIMTRLYHRSMAAPTIVT